MKNRLLKRICMLVLTFFMMFSYTISYASTLTSKKQDVENKIDKVNQNVSDIKTQKTSVMKQLESLEASMAEIDGEISKLDIQLDDINVKMDVAQKELDELEQKRERHYELLKLRMRDMYENSTVSYLDMFLEADNFMDLMDRIYNASLIMEKDQEVLVELKKLEEEVRIKRDEIEEGKVEVELLKTKQEVKKKAMQSNIDTQSNLISKLKNTEQAYINQLTMLEKEAKQIEDLINGKTDSSLVYSGGLFTWPVPGWTSVSSGYGQRGGFYLQDGSWSKPQFHTGIDIPASKGTPIVAAAAGKVITAGWVNGYGYTVLIDHGSGLVTLYGHNSALVVKVGQSVTKGQQISKCGSTGYSSGNHCHFEVRKNGSHTNPWNYLKG